MDLGFEDRSRYKNILLSLKKFSAQRIELLRADGVFTNFWGWFVVLLQWGFSLLLFISLLRFHPGTRALIGLNLDNEPLLDSLFSFSFLYWVPAVHLGLGLASLLLLLLYNKKVQHLFFSLSLISVVSLYIEWRAFDSLLRYFL